MSGSSRPGLARPRRRRNPVFDAAAALRQLIDQASPGLSAWLEAGRNQEQVERILQRAEVASSIIENYRHLPPGLSADRRKDIAGPIYGTGFATFSRPELERMTDAPFTPMDLSKKEGGKKGNFPVILKQEQQANEILAISEQYDIYLAGMTYAAHPADPSSRVPVVPPEPALRVPANSKKRVPLTPSLPLLFLTVRAAAWTEVMTGSLPIHAFRVANFAKVWPIYERYGQMQVPIPSWMIAHPMGRICLFMDADRTPFRLDESGIPVDLEDKPLWNGQIPNPVFVAHPALLSDDEIGAWSSVFADYGIISPQMWMPDRTEPGKRLAWIHSLPPVPGSRLNSDEYTVGAKVWHGPFIPMPEPITISTPGGVSSLNPIVVRGTGWTTWTHTVRPLRLPHQKDVVEEIAKLSPVWWAEIVRTIRDIQEP